MRRSIDANRLIGKLFEDVRRSGHAFWYLESICEFGSRSVQAFWHPERHCDDGRCSVHAFQDPFARVVDVRFDTQNTVYCTAYWNPGKLFEDGGHLFWYPERVCEVGWRSVQAFWYSERLCDDRGHSVHHFNTRKSYVRVVDVPFDIRKSCVRMWDVVYMRINIRERCLRTVDVRDTRLCEVGRRSVQVLTSGRVLWR